MFNPLACPVRTGDRNHQEQADCIYLERILGDTSHIPQLFLRTGLSPRVSRSARSGGVAGGFVRAISDVACAVRVSTRSCELVPIHNQIFLANGATTEPAFQYF